MARAADDKPAFCHGLDCPHFEVKENSEDYQLRSYAKAKWASTNIEGYSYDKAMKTGFWKLFKYIGGANEGHHKVKMTAPVRTRVHPSDGPYCKSNFTISFYIPTKFQDKPPKPENDEVFIEETPAFDAYVVSYGGWQSEERFTKKAAELFEQLDQKGVTIDKDQYYVAGYDSPFRLMNRHNEVWLLAEEKGQSLPKNSFLSDERIKV